MPNHEIFKKKEINNNPPPPLQRLRGPPYGEDRG